MRIALFVTCLGDTLYPETGKATVALLERLGHEVVFPAEQTCCGQMHINTGYFAEATACTRCCRPPKAPPRAPSSPHWSAVLPTVYLSRNGRAAFVRQAH